MARVNVRLDREVRPVFPAPERPIRDRDMQIVFAMDVLDPFSRRDGAPYVRRFTYETREEAWAKYMEAIRFGFEATVEEVARRRRAGQTATA
jgi:hypothetical protein